jgi:hypothetical protein
MFLVTSIENLVKEIQWNQILICNGQLLYFSTLNNGGLVCQIKFLDLVQKLNDLVIFFSLVFLFDDQIRNIVEREELRFHDAFSSDNCCKVSEHVCLYFEVPDLVLEYPIQILDLKNLV